MEPEIDTEPAESQEFAREIVQIYADLLSRQEPLGAEFKAALLNVDELYEP